MDAERHAATWNTEEGSFRVGGLRANKRETIDWRKFTLEGAGERTHVLCAIGHALVEAGRRILYTSTTDMVQKLQAARRDLALEAALTKLDKFDLIILDDITYAQKDQAESSVLFELIARRYETKSLAIAANQPFRSKPRGSW